ncbi:MAG: phosphatase PAP2 family protein [Sandaracinaceae bacterium]
MRRLPNRTTSARVCVAIATVIGAMLVLLVAPSAFAQEDGVTEPEVVSEAETDAAEPSSPPAQTEAPAASSTEPPSTEPAPPEPPPPALPQPELSDETNEGLDDEDPSEDVVERLGEAMGELGSSLGPYAPQGRLRWDTRWPRYRFDELVVTLGMGLVIGLEEVLPTRGDPNWTSPPEFDLAVANAMGLDDPFARDVLDELSSGLGIVLFLWPVGFDALLYAGLGEGAWDVGWQLSLISLEVFAINHAIGVLVRLLGRRERPLGYYCREEPGYDVDPICRSQPPAESFWSSHVSNAFAGAALICLQHDVVDLYGDEVSDAMACGSALALAATTGVFRLMSNQNWMSDVLIGAAVGGLTGVLVPWLLHFQGGARPPLRGTEAPTITFLPMMGEDVIGMTSSGTF